MHISFNVTKLSAMGKWLEENMPNPPLPEPQRWTIIGKSMSGHMIDIPNEQDATWFALVWGGQ